MRGFDGNITFIVVCSISAKCLAVVSSFFPHLQQKEFEALKIDALVKREWEIVEGSDSGNGLRGLEMGSWPTKRCASAFLGRRGANMSVSSQELSWFACFLQPLTFLILLPALPTLPGHLDLST